MSEILKNIFRVADIVTTTGRVSVVTSPSEVQVLDSSGRVRKAKVEPNTSGLNPYKVGDLLLIQDGWVKTRIREVKASLIHNI